MLCYKIVMKKIILLLSIISIITVPCYGEEIMLEGVEPAHIELPKNNVKYKDSLMIDNDTALQEIINKQKEKDLEDIEALWKGTVDNNQVIGFALKKLATPESQRRIHASLMSKTLSALVAGASFAPAFMGGNYLTQTGAFAAGRLAQTLINKKNVPKETPLTDTEMIELAGLVENLQDRIITSYYNYKASLSQLKETRSKLLLYNRNFSKAMEEDDLLEITLSSSLYDNMQMEETYYLEQAKKYHLELQRLAGKKVVDSLNMYQYNYNAAMFKDNGGAK